jgi:hypothetical protein
VCLAKQTLNKNLSMLEPQLPINLDPSKNNLFYGKIKELQNKTRQRNKYYVIVKTNQE